MELIATIRHEGSLLEVFTATYATNGRLAVVLREDDGMPYAKVSVNLPEQTLAADEIVISHNLPIPVLRELLDAGVLEETGRGATFGYTGGPICRVVEWPAITKLTR